MIYHDACPRPTGLRLLAEHARKHYNAASYFSALEFLSALNNSDGLVVTRGIFTLPLPATDAPSGPDGSAVKLPFIAGPENELLRSFVEGLSAVPALFNPITLYGPSGVGKSHLLFGSVSYLRSVAEDRRVMAMNGADFSRMYARAVELDSLGETRERIQAADVFIVDGLQELTTKRAAQQELVHTVDDACARESLLLFSCNVSPTEWTWMLPALRSRLMGGLILPVSLPQLSTRIEMVRTLAADLAVPLDEETILELASGAAKSRSAPVTYSHLRGLLLQRLNTFGPQSLADSSKHRDSRDCHSMEKTTRRIAKAVAQQFDLKLTDLLGSSRRHSVVRARGIAMYLARSLLALSYEQLGRAFGGRDHTTVMHAYHKTVESLSTDHVLKQTVERLTSQLASTMA